MEFGSTGRSVRVCGIYKHGAQHRLDISSLRLRFSCLGAELVGAILTTMFYLLWRTGTAKYETVQQIHILTRNSIVAHTRGRHVKDVCMV